MTLITHTIWISNTNIYQTINAIRTKDDSIYNQQTKFFPEQKEDDDDNDGMKRDKKQKRKLYKDMVREEILKKMEGDDNIDDDDDENDDVETERDDDKITDKRNNVSKLAYDEEQVALRSAFLSSDGQKNDDGDDSDGNNDDGWLQKKVNKGELCDDDETEKSRLEEIAKLVTTDDSNRGDKKTKIVDPKGEIEDGEKFLFDFIKNKKWVDHDLKHEVESDDNNHKKVITGEADDGNQSDTSSLNELNKTDDFESRYNFRFEEANNDENTSSGAGLSVVGYARSSLSDTVRRKDETRKLKRQQRKERKLAERKAKEERLKRLKNAKKEELEERITQIKSILSDKAPETSNEVVDEEIVAKLMDGDFDPDKFEELMSKMYNDDYYEKEDSDWKTDSDVKDSLKKSSLKDDKDILTGIEDREEDEEDNYEETIEADQDMYDENEGEHNEDFAYDDHQEDDNEYHKDDDKNGNVLEKKLKERMMDELYKLDYEDLIGDMPTRFKYRKVEANRYGLRAEEILFSRDTTLKQFVSLKRMAPYDESGEYVPGTKRRKKFREMAKDDYENLLEDQKDTIDKSSSEIQSIQNQKKKRRRQKKLKNNLESNEKNEMEATNTGNNDSEQLNTSLKDELPDTNNSKNGRKKKGQKVKKNDKDVKKVASGEIRKTDKQQGLISKSRLASYNF